MHYTPAQIIKLLLEIDWMKSTPDISESDLAPLNAELDQVFATQERDFMAVAKSIYQEAT